MSLRPDTSLRCFPLSGRALATAATAGPNRILDLTHRPRLGLRGPGTPEWCARNALPFPDAVNGVATAEGLRIARLGRFELLLIAATDRPLPADFHRLPPGSWSGYREDGWAWFRVDGPGTMPTLSALTSADLRPTGGTGDRVVQTRLAGLDAVLVLAGSGAHPAVEIFADIAASDYLVDVFGDRCPEFAVCRPG